MMQLELAVPGKFTQVSLELDESLSYDDWRIVGFNLAEVREWVQFSIGDWLQYGDHHFGEKYAQAASDLGIPEDRLMILKHVASRIPVTLRRTELSWAHHKEIAKLSHEEQAIWLNLAAENHWSLRDLIHELTEAGLRQTRLVTPQDEAVESEKGNGEHCSCCGGVVIRQVNLCIHCIDYLQLRALKIKA